MSSEAQSFNEEPEEIELQLKIDQTKDWSRDILPVGPGFILKENMEVLRL